MAWHLGDTPVVRGPLTSLLPDTTVEQKSKSDDRKAQALRYSARADWLPSPQLLRSSVQLSLHARLAQKRPAAASSCLVIGEVSLFAVGAHSPAMACNAATDSRAQSLPSAQAPLSPCRLPRGLTTVRATVVLTRLASLLPPLSFSFQLDLRIAKDFPADSTNFEMRHSRKNVFGTGLVALASHATAQVNKICPVANVCFSLNIPESTASSGSGDIFFQLSAPSNHEYVALGQGTSMSGSNMFVVYTSGDGNITLSPRLGTGEVMPRFNPDAEVTLLAGSGVSNGMMTANVRCSSCNTWSGGSASFSGDNGNWIFASRSAGGPKDSTSQEENISQHDDHNTFQWNYANAKGGNSVNPLVAAAGSGSGTASGGGSTRTSCVPRPAGAAGTGTAATGAASGASSRATATKTKDYDDDDRSSHTGRPTNWPSDWTRPTAQPTGESGEDYDRRALLENMGLEIRQEINYCDENNSSNSFTPINIGSIKPSTKILIAHGVLASLAFVVFFPMGAIAIRLVSFTGVVWFHAAFQIFGYAVYIAGFGLGLYFAIEDDYMSENHPIIGIVVFAVLFFQPIFGLLHHNGYKKYQTRTVWSHMHLWLGRLAITLGIINGGLGLELAGNSRSGEIAYGVIAGVIWLAWVAAIVIGERRRNKAVVNEPQKFADSPREVSQTAPLNGHYAPSK
ncbi:hypothetical protein BU23DRAFT_595257 [Bimuria novae-zelandiae CBS 107.79]|uniref:Cytochrome b561 domain-containing protein n=1 Tax=Bimuria novae-zelandiae CBS 107.79 TaxID=1447943 RepID=A0A6A5VUI2_9PLEO|nr:hypothetical protein BU23DRAFT_595257 [Bimuria novae-zelandiae CBS 107.79]